MYALKDAKEGKTGEENSRVSNLGVLVSNVKEFEASMQAQAEKASSDEEAKDINADNVEDSACGSRVLSTSGEFVEVLNFRHFARYMSFTPTGKQGKKKQIMNGIEVSVVLHLV